MPSNSTYTENSLLPSQEVITRLAISESGFVFDPVSGHSFTANETGLSVLRQLHQNRNLKKLIQSLAAEYDAEPRELERDIVEFLGTLRKLLGLA